MVEQVDRDAAESFYEGPCTRGMLETILSHHRIAAEARGMAEIERLREALREARNLICSDEQSDAVWHIHVANAAAIIDAALGGQHE